MPSPFKPVQVFNPTIPSAPTVNPNIASGLSIDAGGAPLVNGAPIVPPLSQNAQTANTLMGPLVTPTPTGGTVVHPSVSAAYNTQAVTPPPSTQTSNSGASALAQYTHTTSSTPNGGTLSFNGNGAPSGYTSGGNFSIDSNGAVPSDALSTYADPYSTHKSQQDFVNGVAQANGYSPGYVQAVQGQYGAQTQGAQLALNSAALNSNLYTGNNLPGDTMNYAQGATAKAQAQNTLGQAENQIQQLSANQALNTQQLVRTGNIATAQAQLQYSPTSIAQQNAQAQYNALQQQYGGVQTPAFDPSQDPQAQLQNLHNIIAQSGAYQAGFLSPYTTAAGGTAIYNKLNLQQNQDGTITLVGDGAAIAGASDRAAASQLTTQYNSLVPSYQAANNDFSYITNFMSNNGINQSNVPAINQVQQQVQAKLLDPGAVAAFKAGIASLRTNYAALLGARGETPSQAGNDAATLVPDDLSPAQLTQVQSALNANGKNIIDATGQQLQGILAKYSQGSSNTTGLVGGAGAGGSSNNPFSASSFTMPLNH